MTELPLEKVTTTSDSSVPVWQSKTMWVALLMAIVPAFPPAAALVAANPELTSVLAGLVVAGLRLVSSKKVTVRK